MRNLIAIIIFASLFAYDSKAQSYEGTVDYQKKDEKAIIIEFPYPSSVVEDAIIDKMEKLGCKKKESKGFLVYKNATVTDISTEPADFLIKVEKKSRKENDQAIVYFIVSRKDENIIARSDALVNSNVKTFLNRLSPDVEAYNLEVQIKEQETILAKSEKKLKDMKEDQESMEKKIKKLEDDLKENTNNQYDQQKEIEKQKQILEMMRSKRKTL
ncbi:MAG TPA: hypothetical protein VGQ09_20140 [Chitinophagaceae bacterium]|jgi:hypothetical protein|nr:hypothetical protein [Chitinophagaceae bacterium]